MHNIKCYSNTVRTRGDLPTGKIFKNIDFRRFLDLLFVHVLQCQGEPSLTEVHKSSVPFLDTLQFVAYLCNKANVMVSGITLLE